MHDRSDYETVSILYVDIDQSPNWPHLQQAIRSRFLRDGRRISFKSLNDSRRSRALVPFLEATNHLTGVLFTVAIRKALGKFCGGDQISSDPRSKTLQLDPGWKSLPFERMLRIVHVVSLMMGKFSQPQQNIIWISDEDEIFGNHRRMMDLKRMLDSFSSHYVSHPLGQLGLGTTIIDEADRADEDLNSITDLACGAVAEMVTALLRECPDYIPSALAIPFRGSVSRKTEIIYDWFEAGSSGSLRRGMVLFRAQSITADDGVPHELPLNTAHLYGIKSYDTVRG